MARGVVTRIVRPQEIRHSADALSPVTAYDQTSWAALMDDDE
jgi:hypothetical protein